MTSRYHVIEFKSDDGKLLYYEAKMCFPGEVMLVFNPLYMNRFFLLVRYNKLGMVYCIYLIVFVFSSVKPILV